MLSRLHLELLTAAVIFAIGALGVIGATELNTGWAADGPQAGFFPFRVALILMAASLLVAVQAWRARAALRQVMITDAQGLRRVLGFALPVIALVGLAQLLGLYVAMAIYLAFTIRVIGGRPWLTSLGVGLVAPLAAFLVFEQWFQVPLLKGPLEIWLGLG
jgi:putative tricarboxylic transport membrane protein